MLGVDFGAPLPLGHFAALERAAELRNGNPTAFPYGTLSEVMRIYHGFSRSEGWWQRHLLASGMVEHRRRGPGVQRNLKAV